MSVAVRARSTGRQVVLLRMRRLRSDRWVVSTAVGVPTSVCHVAEVDETMARWLSGQASSRPDEMLVDIVAPEGSLRVQAGLCASRSVGHLALPGFGCSPKGQAFELSSVGDGGRRRSVRTSGPISVARAVPD